MQVVLSNCVELQFAFRVSSCVRMWLFGRFAVLESGETRGEGLRRTWTSCSYIPLANAKGHGITLTLNFHNVSTPMCLVSMFFTAGCEAPLGLDRVSPAM
jgi:hypothetical protein